MSNHLRKSLLGLTLILVILCFASSQAAAGPIISDQTPADSATVCVLKPLVSARVYSSSPINSALIVLAINGNRVTHNYQEVDDNQGTVSFTPWVNMENESYHQVNLTVYDQTGVSASAAWSFYINTYGEMPADMASCAQCHPDTAAHPTGNCALCHELNSHGGEGAPLGDCMWCHNFLYNAGFTYMPHYPDDYTHDGTKLIEENRTAYYSYVYCIDCHTSADFPLIPRHGDPAAELLKHKVDSALACRSCHSKMLTREHARRQDSTNNPLNCSTCHTNNAAPVQNAVAKNNTQCSACHSRLHQLASYPKLPEDVLLYPGVTWSSPIPLSVWQGEPWVDEPRAGENVIMSKRNNLSLMDVWNFYNNGLTARGWSSPDAPAPDANSFKAVFSKGTDKIIVWFYNSDIPAGQNTVSSGARIMVIF